MKKETAKLFLSKFVKLERLRPEDEKSFFIYGLIEDIDDEFVIIRSRQGLGTIRLCDTVSITEFKER